MSLQCRYSSGMAGRGCEWIALLVYKQMSYGSMDMDPDNKTEHLKGIHQLVIAGWKTVFLAQHFTRYGYEMYNVK